MVGGSHETSAGCYRQGENGGASRALKDLLKPFERPFNREQEAFDRPLKAFEIT